MHRGTPAHDRAVDAVGWQTRSGSKSGFTLVELLVVLVIIGMLASMVSFAMFRSMQAARQAKTQALISKLHNVIARHWDTFETGQIPFTHGGDIESNWMNKDSGQYEIVRFDLPRFQIMRVILLRSPFLIDKRKSPIQVIQVSRPLRRGNTTDPTGDNYATSRCPIAFIRLVTSTSR